MLSKKTRLYPIRMALGKPLFSLSGVKAPKKSYQLLSFNNS